MCGIAGIVASNGAAVDSGVLQRMNDLLAHRGPDGAAFMLATGGWADLRYAFSRTVESGSDAAPIRVGLGHRRLAILDLSDRGLQPMRTPDGRCWIVFNGEIYNHRELRTALTARGHEFGTRTDTEVLLRAYLEWGDDCLSRLEGMYAFALWDGFGGRLFCARDRLGIKPFYYTNPDGQFAFASEIKALTAMPQFEARADDLAVLGFLTHSNCDYGSRTTFRGVSALPAAHALDLDAATGRVSIRRYWTLGAAPIGRQSDREHVDRVRSSMLSSVRKHLISDVRAGSCLSGGLDSSTVVALIGHLQQHEPETASAVGGRLHTFTSCYDEQQFDERAYALNVARSVGARSTLVFPSARDFWGDFEKMAWHQDMPFGALSYYAQWRVMRAAREAGVKVLLDGQGGDEVFGGYAKFRYAYIASSVRSGAVTTAARELAAMVGQGDRYVLDLRNGYRYLPASVRTLLNVDSVLKRVLIPDLRLATADESTPATRWWRHARRTAPQESSTLMQRIQIDDIVTDTLPQLLRMEDRSSMAFSLEARVPLLDHTVVELGLSLPDRLKVNGGWSKFAVREAMTGLLPEPVRLRTSKLGFAAPDRMWLTNDLQRSVSELLAGDLRCRKYVDAEALRRWYGSPRARTANTESYLGFFRILSVEMWMRAFSLS